MTKLIDLSVPLTNFAHEYNSPKITYWDHEDFARRTSTIWGLNPDEFPEPGVGSASEELTLSSHSGTHLDAPWHFGPTTGDKRSLTIDEVPLEWCYGDGVVLDFSVKKTDGESIDVEDLKQALHEIEYELKPLDIVMLRTTAGARWGKSDFNDSGAGLTANSVFWLVEQGIRMITTDAFSLDIPLRLMAEKLKRGDSEGFFPAHRAGRIVEYVHAEKVVNLELLPSTGFKVALFPIKIRKGSAGWCRAVAILED